MEDLIKGVLEQSVTAGILVAVLWVFLPRLIKSIDSLSARNSAGHRTILMLLTHMEVRLNWHEAKMHGVDPTSPGTEEHHKTATESFMKAEAGINALRDDLKEYFDKFEK